MKNELVTLTKDTVISPTSDTRYIVDISKLNEAAIFEIVFKTEGVTAEIIALYNLQKNMNVKFSTIARHIAPHTSCETVVKGILGEMSQSDYIGKILIERNAQQTSSFLHHDVLVTGDNTKNNTQPILEIEANDVKASHGATTGRINKAELFYLKSRGFTEKEASDLIIEGFFESTFRDIDDESIIDSLKETLCIN